MIGGDAMATKSIIKDVNIKDKKLANAFVYAMEKSKEKKSKEVVLSRTCEEASAETIRLLFGTKR